MGEELIGRLDEQIRYDVKKMPVLSTNISEPPKNVRLQKPRIDLKLCQKNYNCVIFCPHNAIAKNASGQPVIDYEICTGCLICLRECPAMAISEERE